MLLTTRYHHDLITIPSCRAQCILRQRQRSTELYRIIVAICHKAAGSAKSGPPSGVAFSVEAPLLQPAEVARVHNSPYIPVLPYYPYNLYHSYNDCYNSTARIWVISFRCNSTASPRFASGSWKTLVKGSGHDWLDFLLRGWCAFPSMWRLWSDKNTLANKYIHRPHSTCCLDEVAVAIGGNALI